MEVAIKSEYDTLRDMISVECDLPDDLFPAPGENEKNCYFLFGYETCRFLFIDSRYESFMGFSPKEHQQGGLDFWFSRVHPEDRRMLGDRILESFQMSKHSSHRSQPNPNILNYRFKKGTGEWIWMQHTVYNLSYDHNGKVNKVLHRLRLLDVLTDPDDQAKRGYKVSLDTSEGMNKLTSRERQILKLIAEGFSSKMIADVLVISINTVETHRRHLLEKLEAKNSMELIRKAFRMFWN